MRIPHRLAGLALAPLAAAALVVAPGSPALAAPHCDPGWFFTPTQDHGRSHQGVGPQQANYNGTTQVVRSTFTATVSGTVTFTSSTEVKGGANLAIASAESKYGLNLSYSLQVTAGNSVSVNTPPRKTTHAQYGAYRRKVTGKNGYTYSNCNQGQISYPTTYSPWYVGWALWES
jgi:hypothetical protein